MRITKKLLTRIRAEAGEIDEHDLRAIVSCLAASVEERARQLDAEADVLMSVRGLGAKRARYFKSSDSYRRWQNGQPDVGGWEWKVLMERVAGKRPLPRV